MTTAPLQTKRHYESLDGLRGVAALIVVAFHTLEEYSFGDHTRQILNHGYLAVDFFFLLSGFVVAYAYDDRWNRMSVGGFFSRRLIRLQPMVIMGSLIGTVALHWQTGPVFPGIAAAPVWKVVVLCVVGCTLFPLLPGKWDIRGWQEMHPLNGPAWSLLYEYVANFLYAVWLRRLSQRVLGVLTGMAAVAVVYNAVTQGDMIGGWALDASGIRIGLSRLLFPFLAGMLLMRSGWRIPFRGAFGWASALLALCLCLPRFGGHAHPWVNGVYESVCILLVFPVIVAVGAGEGKSAGSASENRLAGWLGAISYPLYITHYALIYIWTAWVFGPSRPTAGQAAPWGALLFLTAIAIAWACLKLYDEPVRRWLSRRLLGRATA